MMSYSSSIMVHITPYENSPLSKSNGFDQDFMRLGHIVKYRDVLFKFDKGPYCTMLSGVMSLCL